MIADCLRENFILNKSFIFANSFEVTFKKITFCSAVLLFLNSFHCPKVQAIPIAQLSLPKNHGAVFNNTLWFTHTEQINLFQYCQVKKLSSDSLISPMFATWQIVFSGNIARVKCEDYDYIHCFYAYSKPSESKSRLSIFSIRPFLIYPAIPAYPFLDETFYAKNKQIGISNSSLSALLFLHLYSRNILAQCVPQHLLKECVQVSAHYYVLSFISS